MYENENNWGKRYLYTESRGIRDLETLIYNRGGKDICENTKKLR